MHIMKLTSRIKTAPIRPSSPHHRDHAHSHRDVSNTITVERSSAKKIGIKAGGTHSISPNGGLIIFGVTPKTSFIIFLDHPNSAMTSSLLNDVNAG
jgi:hypothetical protein